MAEVEVKLNTAGARLEGGLTVFPGAAGVVAFAHGSGSSRHSPRNRAVAEELNRSGIATLLFDLLTAEEERTDRVDAAQRFDIDLLTARLSGAVAWLGEREETAGMRIGLFGASTGAAAALRAAAEQPHLVAGVVSRGGRPDLAGVSFLRRVGAPTLLVVGGADPGVLALNREAARDMGGPCRVHVVPHATHLFEERGAIEEVADVAAAWFLAAFSSQEGREPS